MQNTTPPSRGRYDAQARAALIARFGDSGLSFEQFAQQHQLNPGTFRHWLYQAKKTSRPKRGVPVFQELRPGPLAGLPVWAAELQLANGLAIRLGAGCDVHWIGQLIHRLSQPC